ncbi:hypothetical protein BDAP_001609 [Binucleata daphniae]
MLEDGGMVLALGSQDKSISLWYNKNPRPFLLIKNIFEQPILDMFWKENDLYACSYDGKVKILQFEKNEFGFLAENYVMTENKQAQIPFSKSNIDILENGINIGNEQSMFKSLTEDEYKNLIDSLYFENDVNDKINNTYIINCTNKNNEITTNVQNTVKQQTKTQTKESMDYGKTNIQSADKHVNKMQVNKTRTRIQSILISQLEQTDTVYIDKQNKNFAIFKPYKKPKIEKLEQIENIYETKVYEFTIKILNSKKSTVTIHCGTKELYKLYYAYITLFACNKTYICFVVKENNADSLVIHFLETGVLVMPVITYFYIVQISLHNHLLLILSGDSFFQVLNIKNQKEVSSGFLPSTDELTNIKLDEKYFIVAQFKNTVYFYDKKMKVWYKKNHNFDTIFFDNNSQTIFDDSSEHDDTICKLEYKFNVYEKVKDIQKMIKTTHKIIKICTKMSFFDDFYASKIHAIFDKLFVANQKRIVIKFLEEMNVIAILQPFVLQMMRMFDDKLKSES